MREYVTEGVVLGRMPRGELDLRVFFYTRDFGRISATARSARRITSKLAPHLEPLNFVRVRLIEKNGFQVVDALRHGQLPKERLSVLAAVAALAPVGEPDAELWSLLERGEATVPLVLASLGFDSEHASCASCGKSNPKRFSIPDLEYRCVACSGGLLQHPNYLEV